MKYFIVRSTLLLCCLGLLHGCGIHSGGIPESENLQISPPVLAKKIIPYYPPEASALGIEGDVRLYLYINTGGDVELTKLVKSSGFPELDRAAEEYARLLKFTPATRGGAPLAVWMSWEVNYNLFAETTKFNINNYVKKIQTLNALARSADRGKREKYINDILMESETYFDFIRQNSRTNLNRKLQQILLDRVWDQWQAYWQEWPLTFVLMQDLEMRYPDSRSISLIRDIKISQVFEDIQRIGHADGNLKDNFYQAVYDYLKKNHPEALEDDRSVELQRFQIGTRDPY